MANISQKLIGLVERWDPGREFRAEGAAKLRVLSSKCFDDFPTESINFRRK